MIKRLLQFCFVVSFLGVVLQAQPYQQNSAIWAGETSVDGSVLKRTWLSGHAVLGSRESSAEFQVECRADAESARLNLQFLPDALEFDVGPYEGPGAYSGSHHVLTLKVGAATSHSHTVSGFFVEHNLFVVSTALSQAETKALLGGKGQVELRLQTSKVGQPLLANFQLPRDSAPAAVVLTPCIHKRP